MAGRHPNPSSGFSIEIMDGNQTFDIDAKVKEEMIDDVFVECKTEVESLKGENDVCDDLWEHKFVTKEEFLDDFIPEHVKEEPMDGEQVDESLLSDPGIKLESEENAADTMCDPDIDKISDDGSGYDFRKKHFACQFCSFTTRTKYLAKQHMKRHKNMNPVAHRTTDYRAKCQSQQSRHKLNRTGKTIHRCCICDYKSHQMKHFNKHMLTVHGGKLLACPATKNSTLKTHMLTHVGEKQYNCDMCDYRTCERSDLKKHLLLRHRGKPYTCHTCNYQTTHKSDLRKHMPKHSNERPYACDSCDYRAKWKPRLRNHMATHSKERPYACENCDYRSKSKGVLKTHMISHSVEKPYACDVCDYRALSMKHLKCHLLIHSGEKTYSCNLCDYRALRKNNLKSHLLIHSGEKTYSCNLCDYRAFRKQSLVTHMLMHSGEKPFHCNLCDYKATVKESLKRHMITHSVEKPYYCDLCDYRALSMRHLKSHLLIHSKEKPYSCNLCYYKALRKNNLERHLSTHSSEKSYSCNLCDYRSIMKCQLDHHMLTHSVEKNHSGKNLWACHVCGCLDAGWKSLRSHYLLMHNADAPYSRNVSGRSEEFCSSDSVVFLKLADENLNDPNDDEKAQPTLPDSAQTAANDFASSGLPSETFQDSTNSMYPNPLHDHDYCLTLRHHESAKQHCRSLRISKETSGYLRMNS